MAEYQPIANLRGPQGERGSVEPITLNSQSDSVFELPPEEYEIITTSTSEILGAPEGSVGRLSVESIGTSGRRVLTFTSYYDDAGNAPFRQWVAGVASSGEIRGWHQILPDNDTHLGQRSVSGTIRDLAKRDGWLAVYDPTDMNSTYIDSSGRVYRINDGLGNLPEVRASASGRLDHLPGAFGQLAGMQGPDHGGLLAEFGQTLPQPFTVVCLARADHPLQTGRLFDSQSGGVNRHSIMMSQSGDGPVNFVQQTPSPSTVVIEEADSEPHIFSATFNGQNSFVNVDSRYGSHGAFGDDSGQMTGIRIGTSNSGGTPWQGQIGPILIYPGQPSPEVLNRMQSLLHSASGIKKGAPRFIPSSRVLSVDENGKDIVSVGNPDGLSRNGVASVTKMVTTWLARKWLNTAELMDTEVTAHGDDIQGSMIAEGDVISYRSLFYAAAMESDNAAPNIIARGVGRMMLDESGESWVGQTEREKFIEEMNQEAQALGLDGANFVSAVGSGILSPRHLVTILFLYKDEPVLREIYGAREHTIQITGGPNPRSISLVNNTTRGNRYPFPELVLDKGGEYDGRRAMAMLWQHPNGEYHATAVTDMVSSPAVNRLIEPRKAMQSVLNDNPALGLASGEVHNLERATGTRDITELFDGAQREESYGRISIARYGDTTTLTFTGVSLPDNFSQNGVIPPRFTPPGLISGTVHGGSNVYRFSVNGSGNLSVVGNSEGETLSGTITYNSNIRLFPDTPYPGRPA